MARDLAPNAVVVVWLPKISTSVVIRVWAVLVDALLRVTFDV